MAEAFVKVGFFIIQLFIISVVIFIVTVFFIVIVVVFVFDFVVVHSCNPIGRVKINFIPIC